MCVSSSLLDHQMYFLILKTFLREIVLSHPSIVWGRGNEVCLPLQLDQPTFRPQNLVPSSPARHPVPSGTHRSGPLGSRLRSGLPTSVMQLWGWEEAENEEVETKYEGHREVRFTNLSVSAAQPVGEEHASCLCSSPRRRQAHGCQGELPNKVHFALHSCTSVTPRSLHCAPTL